MGVILHFHNHIGEFNTNQDTFLCFQRNILPVVSFEYASFFACCHWSRPVTEEWFVLALVISAGLWSPTQCETEKWFALDPGRNGASKEYASAHVLRSIFIRV